MRILLIEDDPKIAENVAEFLAQSAFAVDTARDGTAGFAAASGSVRYDCIITDVMLPGMDGMTIVRNLRAAGSKIPVLMLTAKGEISDRVEGLDSGADDYLPKPFSLRELEARIRSLLRRTSRNPESSGVLSVGDLSLDLAKKTAVRDGKEIPLSRKHFQLLELLMRNEGRVLSKSEIEESVWDRDAELWSDVVRSHMQMLRAKVDTPFKEPLIRNVRGMGYVMERPKDGRHA
jgi:DNA-binding response OmpR family regulator